MTKKLVLAAALALLAVPAAAAEERPVPADKAGDKAAKEERAAERQVRKTDLKLATRYCLELKHEVGRAAFKATYPTFRACVLARVEAERANRSEARAECLAKLADKKLGRRAKAKRLAACMATTAASDSALEREAVVNAAKSCAEELAADPAGFRAEYGRNHDLANAFGKCVAAHAKAKADSEDDGDEAKDADEAEQEASDEGELPEDEDDGEHDGE